MKNTQNNQIKTGVFSVLGILAIFTVTLIALPAKVSADNSGYVTPYGATSYPYNNVNTNGDYNVGGTYMTDTTPVQPAPVQTRVVTRTVYVNNPNQNTVSSTNNTTDNSNTSATTDDTSGDNSNLGAAVIFGSGGFLPSGIIGWILFAILILIIVILVRKVTGGAKRYQEEPLKHA